MLQPEEDSAQWATVWTAVGDLMACLLGVFVLFFAWIVTFEVSLADDLASERQRREQAASRLAALESALAGPLSSGMITLADGRIGIRGSVLFDLNSAELRPEGKRLLREMAQPLSAYLSSKDESLMVSGFTDDQPMRGVMRSYHDNWELSAQRALTAVRGLIDVGVPAEALFAAGFGENHPVAPNDSEDNRARNRRVEIAPVPRPEPFQARVRAALSPTSHGGQEPLGEHGG